MAKRTTALVAAAMWLALCTLRSSTLPAHWLAAFLWWLWWDKKPTNCMGAQAKPVLLLSLTARAGAATWNHRKGWRLLPRPDACQTLGRTGLSPSRPATSGLVLRRLQARPMSVEEALPLAAEPEATRAPRGPWRGRKLQNQVGKKNVWETALYKKNTFDLQSYLMKESACSNCKQTSQRSQLTFRNEWFPNFDESVSKLAEADLC